MRYNQYSSKTLFWNTDFMSESQVAEVGKFLCVWVPDQELKKDCKVTYIDGRQMWIAKGSEYLARHIKPQQKNTDKPYWGCYFKWTPAKREEEKVVRMIDVFSAMPQDKLEELKIKLGLIK